MFTNKNYFFDEYLETRLVKTDIPIDIEMSLNNSIGESICIIGAICVLSGKPPVMPELISDSHAGKISNLKICMGFDLTDPASYTCYCQKVYEICKTDDFKKNMENVIEFYKLLIKSKELNGKNDHMPHFSGYNESKGCLLLGLYSAGNNCYKYLLERSHPDNFMNQYILHNYIYKFRSDLAEREHIGRDVFCIKKFDINRGLSYYFSCGEYIGIARNSDRVWRKTKILEIRFRQNNKYHMFPIIPKAMDKDFIQYKKCYSITTLDKDVLDKLSKEYRHKNIKDKNDDTISPEIFYDKDNFKYLKLSRGMFYNEIGIKTIIKNNYVKKEKDINKQS